MTLPPERISVKRRREEAPIDRFYLEEPSRAKRRITGQSYHFKLLKSPIAPLSQQDQHVNHSVSTRTAGPPIQDKDGIPSIRTTAPGDEIADFTRFRQQQQAPEVSSTLPNADDTPDANVKAKGESSSMSSTLIDLPKHARRFHLTRDLSSSYSPSKPTGIRKKGSRGTSLRPPLPTFIERQPYDEVYAKPPVDRIVHDSGKPIEMSSASTPGKPPTDSVAVPSFTKPKASPSKSGASINDPSATWNRESDQLADELAALAMEFDPDIKSQPSPPRTAGSPELDAQPSTTLPRTAPVEDEYIYETYIRMANDKDTADTSMFDTSAVNVGVLVIDEEDEDLWEGYMQSDEDTDWDDEDSNAEDNPANDYPDEELSSDDEFSRNPYRYHHADDYDDDDDEDNYN